MLREVLDYICERLAQAYRVLPDTPYKEGYRDGSVNELEVLQDYIEEEVYLVEDEE
ncbi:MAG: hypothetical protein ACREBU_09370 [Nitrososphaera sp.]